MKQEDKELLLRDLSARLPYGVKVQPKYDTNEAFKLYSLNVDDNEIKFFTFQGKAIEICEHGKVFRPSNRLIFKPYLFPLSSITEEQSLELFELFGIDILDSTIEDYIKINEVTGITFFLQKGFDVETHLDKLIDWLLKNHFDFRGLIPKGLALDATGLNIY